MIELVFCCRVHELFLYNDDLKKAKFRFGEFISHRNLVTNQLDMKVHNIIVTEIFVDKQIKTEDQIKYSLYMYTVPSTVYMYMYNCTRIEACQIILFSSMNHFVNDC